MDATMLFYCFAKDFSIKETEKLMPKLAHTTVVRFFKKLRCVTTEVISSIKIDSTVDGTQDIVEIDESLFGKRQKHNKGRRTERVWIFGLAQRKSRKTFFTLVKDRTSETLLSIIKEKVEPGVMIYHDDWAAYNKLNEHGYDHGIVVHSREFISESGVCTNTIEGTLSIRIFNTL